MEKLISPELKVKSTLEKLQFGQGDEACLLPLPFNFNYFD